MPLSIEFLLGSPEPRHAISECAYSVQAERSGGKGNSRSSTGSFWPVLPDWPKLCGPFSDSNDSLLMSVAPIRKVLTYQAVYTINRYSSNIRHTINKCAPSSTKPRTITTTHEPQSDKPTQASTTYNTPHEAQPNPRAQEPNNTPTSRQ